MSKEKLGTAQGAEDFVSPGPCGVIRCDNDPISDPHLDRGSIQWVLEGGTR
jgi:hypothetical protein